jgi:SAM-dependent methyltransferase
VLTGMSDTLSTSRWDAADYARVGGFVPALGIAALDLLAPRAGETILDVGCGDGTLTLEIRNRGAEVVGIDNDLSMVAAAKAKGLDVRLMDAGDLKFSEAFDAAFSNATLHWVLAKQRAARAIWFALRPGGRFAGEMGGAGNLATLRRALDDELVARGFGPPTYAANWYPDLAEFTELYEEAGFRNVEAELIDRPTRLDHGVAQWVLVFRRGWLDRAGVPEVERPAIAQGVAARVGHDIADYVRLRFTMRKP